MRLMQTLIPLVLLAGCGTVVHGNSQKLALTSEPAGAECGVYRNGEKIAEVTTPGTVLIGRSKRDVSVVCVKPGYQQARVTDKSDLSEALAGNVVFLPWSVVSTPIDFVTGGAHAYDSPVGATLSPGAGESEKLPTKL